MRDFLKKLQKQPEYTRKLILWCVVVVVGFVLAIWWIYGSYWRIKKFQTEDFIKGLNLPSFEEELPEIEIPEIKND